jgi:hypothetical protein
MPDIGTAETVRIWITDGSLVPFADVTRLPAAHRGFLGLRATYKGCLDPAVPVGTATIGGARPDDAFFPEAEWCVLVPGGRGQPAAVDEATPVVLQGLIEGKWLNRLLGTSAWRPATLGNNLLAAGHGIATTLGAIERGEVAGEVAVAYRYRADGQERTRVQRTTLADLRGQNILGLVRAVLRVCAQAGQALEGVDCSALGETAAVVNERPRLRAGLRFAHLPLLNPLNLLRRRAVAERVIAGILDEGHGAPPGEAVRVTTRDQAGQIVGEGALTWRAAVPVAVPEATAAN